MDDDARLGALTARDGRSIFYMRLASYNKTPYGASLSAK